MIDGQKQENKITLQELPAALEAVLFVHGDPITCDQLAEITQMPKEVLEETLARMMKEYETDPWGGLMIRKVDDSYVMCTKPAMKPVLERLFAPRSRPPMSQATYETLAVIAYNQPVTRAHVEAVRGVSSDSIVSRLIERGLVEECGTLEAPGRPTLFRTTKQFLLEFGISSVSEMPAMELMMYKTIRDLQDSLETASGMKDDRQILIENWMEGQKGDEEQ